MSIVNPVHDALKRIDRDPERSFTLPGFYYYDADVYAREMGAIFQRSWLYAGHVCRLARAGDYLVRDIGDQSVIIARDREGGLVGFHNVCQHRAHRLLEGEGRLKGPITCPYHAWSYDLAGALRAIPGGDGAAGIDKADFRLSPVRVEEFLGFVFFNLDADAAPLARQADGMAAQFRSFCAEPEALRLAYRKTYDVAANWKNVIENYSECYHCPGAHPSLANQALDMSDYRIEVHAAYHHHNSGDKGEAQGYAHDPGESPRGGEFGGWFVFPTVSFEFYPGGGLTVFHNVPVAPERTVQHIEWYFAQQTPSADEQAVIDFVDVVRREDFPLVESVQRGLHSLGYSQGRFVVDAGRTYISEHAVHDFQLKVLRALGEIDGPSRGAG
jgi:choline monooxygenase